MNQTANIVCHWSLSYAFSRRDQTNQKAIKQSYLFIVINSHVADFERTCDDRRYNSLSMLLQFCEYEEEIVHDHCWDSSRGISYRSWEK